MDKIFKSSLTGNMIFKTKENLESYLEKNLKEKLNGLSPKQYLFNEKYKITSGQCVICKSATTFNEVTGRYNRFCSDRCIEEYKKQFKLRMNKKYGVDYFTNTAENQIKMLNNRNISGEYNYQNKKKINYNSKYELDFLEFCDKIIKLPSEDITECPFIVFYQIGEEKKYYIPDFYIASLNLIVEIKGSNNHYQKRDLEIEKAKDLYSSRLKKINYIKILDKDYSSFLNKIKSLSQLTEEEKDFFSLNSDEKNNGKKNLESREKSNLKEEKNTPLPPSPNHSSAAENLILEGKNIVDTSRVLDRKKSILAPVTIIIERLKIQINNIKKDLKDGIINKEKAKEDIFQLKKKILVLKLNSGKRVASLHKNISSRRDAIKNLHRNFNIQMNKIEQEKNISKI